MSDRTRYLDSVCGRCKRIIAREETIEADLTQRKAEIVVEGLLPYDYFTDTPKPVTGHANGCQNRPQ